ncbi:MAG: glycosyltransferase [Chitinophagales bacterium]|nr:glycosyltransferase [Chitinophagales bacterium]MCZ2393162.1 glycosyltransferase [Chitinophagales bacterium]
MLVILWWILLVLSYLVYPLMMKKIGKRHRISKYSYYELFDDLPMVQIVMSVHNEEKILQAKLNSILSGNYPERNLTIVIGLDNCSDNSLQIVQEFEKQYPSRIYYFESDRVGKPNMLNILMEKRFVDAQITIFTDANVIFTPSTIYELVKYFKTLYIGLVDSKFVLSSDNISNENENLYLNYEQQLKFNEGIVWGTMQGPFGGCFAIRTKLFSPIPKNFLVDDFFIGMDVMRNGYASIMNPLATVIEEVHTDLQEEIRRKQRIAAGNFQNLKYFSPIFKKPFTALSVSWLLHKVLRWILPLLLIPFIGIDLILNIVWGYPFFLSLVTLILIIGLPLTQYVLQRLNLQNRTVERLNYFIFINFALCKGFYIYLKGIKSNVWKPTQRK